jgi:hypothetical protein
MRTSGFWLLAWDQRRQRKLTRTNKAGEETKNELIAMATPLLTVLTLRFLTGFFGNFLYEIAPVFCDLTGGKTARSVLPGVREEIVHSLFTLTFRSSYVAVRQRRQRPGRSGVDSGPTRCARHKLRVNVAGLELGNAGESTKIAVAMEDRQTVSQRTDGNEAIDA